LYTSDLCIWLLHMLTEGQSGTAYNVGSEHAVSIADFARQVIAVAGVDTSIHIHTAVNQTVLPPRYIPDTKKARDSLHLIEYTPLDLALRKTIEWTRSSLMN
jgi:dTDP-glucose 4,6-dehydratase